jgi:ketosteroid isomerase-like protein
VISVAEPRWASIGSLRTTRYHLAIFLSGMARERTVIGGGAVSDGVAVTFANEAFYAAFASRDLAAMNDAWSRRADVTCLHPGWPPIVGRGEVMKSWRSILLGPSPPVITCHRPATYLFGDVAYVICFEQLGETVLVATNIFVREDATWRLVHHQAGPTTVPSLDASPSVPRALQ